MPGVINDVAATKTVSFKVTDDGAGKLTVERQGDAATPGVLLRQHLHGGAC